MTRNGLALAAAMAIAVAASPAQATVFDLTAPTSSTTGSPVNTGIYGVGTISNIGNALTYATSALTLTATAYSVNSSTGAISAAALNIYSGNGVGIQDQFENNQTPNHAIDNAGAVDFLVLQFDKAVDFASFTVGWAKYDADTTVSWLNSAPLSLDGKNISALSSLALGTTNLDVNGPVTGKRTVSIPTAINTVVVYARRGSGADGTSDYFKVSAVDATAAVPEPATWAMLLVGFGAMGGALRRRRQNLGAVRFA